MDNLESLFEKKQYELIVKLTQQSIDPKELFIRLSSLVILGQDEEALDEIEKYQAIIESKYPARLMKLHFELLLKNRYFDEARIALTHYQNLPYISQAVEEFLRDMPKRIEAEEHEKSLAFSEDEICSTLESETDNGKISEVVFSLKTYNLQMYVHSLKKFMLRKDVHPNLRTFALILLVDNKYNEKVSFLSREGIVEVNPSLIVPPFSSSSFNAVTKFVFENSERNVSLQETALHLVNCLVIDVYPKDIDYASSLVMGQAFIEIAKDYIQIPTGEITKEVLSIKEKIKAIIESTPAIKM